MREEAEITGYNDQGDILLLAGIFSFSLRYVDQFCDQPSILSDAYCGLYRWG